jgi:hypothetical protein
MGGGVLLMAVAVGDTDPCLHCKETLIFARPEDIISAWSRLRWLHQNTMKAACHDGDESYQGPRILARPTNYCDERLAAGEGGVCNRPVKEFGKCGIHDKNARAEFEAQKRIDELVEQDTYVEQTLGARIEYWNLAYDLDASIEERHSGSLWEYRNGRPRYTGYVRVNPGRLNDLMSKIEQEFPIGEATTKNDQV